MSPRTLGKIAPLHGSPLGTGDTSCRASSFRGRGSLQRTKSGAELSRRLSEGQGSWARTVGFAFLRLAHLGERAELVHMGSDFGTPSTRSSSAHLFAAFPSPEQARISERAG